MNQQDAVECYSFYVCVLKRGCAFGAQSTVCKQCACSLIESRASRPAAPDGKLEVSIAVL